MPNEKKDNTKKRMSMIRQHQGKIGIASKANLLEACLTQQCDTFIDVNIGSFMTWAIARTIVCKKYLFGVCQRYNKRMVAPFAVVTDVHSLLAFAIGRSNNTIKINDRLGKK